MNVIALSMITCLGALPARVFLYRSVSSHVISILLNEDMSLSSVEGHFYDPCSPIEVCMRDEYIHRFYLYSLTYRNI